MRHLSDPREEYTEEEPATPPLRPENGGGCRGRRLVGSAIYKSRKKLVDASRRISGGTAGLLGRGLAKPSNFSDPSVSKRIDHCAARAARLMIR